jgi:hypothetical protein
MCRTHFEVGCATAAIAALAYWETTSKDWFVL